MPGRRSRSSPRRRTECGPSVRGDRALLRQALVNLIDNSLKYGPRGQHVQLAAARLGDRVRITVEDEGTGHPAGTARSDVPSVCPARRATGRRSARAAASGSPSSDRSSPLCGHSQHRRWSAKGDTRGHRPERSEGPYCSAASAGRKPFAERSAGPRPFRKRFAGPGSFAALRMTARPALRMTGRTASRMTASILLIEDNRGLRRDAQGESRDRGIRRDLAATGARRPRARESRRART